MISANSSFSLLTSFPELNSAAEWEVHNVHFRQHNVVIKATGKQIQYPEHWGGLSVKMVLDGHESYVINGTEYKLNENTFLILNHDQYYGSFINETQEAKSLTIHFTRKFENEIVNYYNNTDRILDNALINGVISCRSSAIGVAGCHNPEFKQTVHHFSKRMKALKMRLNDNIKNFEINIQAIEELFYDLYVEILVEQGILMQKKENIDAIKSSTTEEIFRRTMFAKDYIESFYYKTNLDLNELAAIACMNRFHLLRCFKKLYGKTPYQYLKKVRFIRAHQLLKTGRYSVSEVVELCGYNDTSSFNKSFKNVFGVNPVSLLPQLYQVFPIAAD